MATSGPSNALIKKRKDKFLRAALAGAMFEKKERTYRNETGVRPSWLGQWFISLPPHRTSRGYVSGPYRWRHLAVDAAMKEMELK